MALVSASIGGAGVAGFQQFDFEIELGLGKRAKRATAKIVYGPELAGTKPRSGQVLKISIGGSEAFEGPIHIVNDKWINPESYEVTIDATDWTPFLDAHLVHTEDLEDQSLPEQTLLERVDWILVHFCPGFTLGTIDNNATLPKQAIDRRPASEVFDELAELTDQVFDLSFDKSVTFAQTGDPAPIGSIDVDSDLTVDSVICTEDWSDLHNVFFIKDFKLRSAYAYEEKFMADGQTSFFSLSLPPWSVGETIVSISKAGGAADSWTDRVSITDSLGNQSAWEVYRGPGTESETEEMLRLMALDEEWQGTIVGVPGTVNICLWNMGIRFPKCDLPGNGDIIRVRYPFERPQQTLEVRDLTSIGVIAAREGTDGIHQQIINLPELRAVSLESAINYARMLLQRGAWPVLTGSFHTYVTGWQARQKFTISSSVRSITDPKPPYGPAEVWASRVIISCPGVKDDGTALIDHTVEFTSLPYAVPIPMDEIIWRLIDRTSWLRPPGTAPPGGTEYTTSTSSSTTTTVTSTSTTMTATSTSTSTTLWEGATTPVRAQVMFTVPGTLSVGTNQPPLFICSIPHHLTLLDTALVVKTAPTGAALEIDIQRSPDCGSTWWSIYATKPTIPAGSKGCDECGELNTLYICKGDLLRLDITQVGSIVAGADLTVSLRVRQGTDVATPICPSGTSTSTSITGTSTSTTTTLMTWQSPSAIYSSCGEHPAGPDDYFIDGNTGSAWIHLIDETHEIIVDMGETKYIMKARLYVYSDQKQSQWSFCTIYVSDNPAVWGTPVRAAAAFTKDYGSGWVEQTFSIAGTGRYVKIATIDTEDVLDHIMGAEFEVYASG